MVMHSSEDIGATFATRAQAHAHGAPADLSTIGAEILAFIERVERIEGEIKELNADKSEIYKEAKGRGYDSAVIKEMVKQRAQDPEKRAEKETVLELYARAVAAVA